MIKPRISYVAVAAALVMLSTSGCAGLGKALGGGKNPPDEFAIATKAPLVVPPDYSLRPPKPGETRPQEVSVSDRAQQLVLGDAGSAPPSVGEQLLLQKSGALASNPSIRSILGAEGGGRADKDGSFANQLMFWKFVDGKVDDSAAPLRVENPEQWFAEREEAIKKVTGEEGKVTIEKDQALGLPGVF